MCGRQADSCDSLGLHVPNRASPVPLAGRIPGTPLHLAWPMEGVSSSIGEAVTLQIARYVPPGRKSWLEKVWYPGQSWPSPSRVKKQAPP